MEFIFLEIIRQLDIKFHKQQTDFYFTNIFFVKNILKNSNLNFEEYCSEINYQYDNQIQSLYHISFLERNNIIKEYDFSKEDKLFYKDRNILLFCLIFLQIISNNFNSYYSLLTLFTNDLKDLCELFVFIISSIKDKLTILQIYKTFTTLTRDSITKSDLDTPIVRDVMYNSINNKLYFNNNIDLYKDFMFGFNLFMNENVFTVGFKKTLGYGINVSLFYTMFFLSSSDSNINLAKLYDILL